MNNLPQIFMYQGTQIRMMVKDNEPWWVAKDVCDVLELGDTGRAIGRLDDDESTRIEIDHPQAYGKKLEVYAVNESGLYSLILGSRKQEAREFKRWITHDVIPAIRKHGTYMTAETIEKVLYDPDLIIGIATKLKEESARADAAEREKHQLEAQREADRPMMLFAESLQVSQDSILIGQLAKLLKQNGIDIGQNRLFQVLREEGYLMSRGERYNMPTQRSMEMKLMEIKVGSRFSPSEGSKVTQTTKVTGKGVMYFINKFKAASEPA